MANMDNLSICSSCLSSLVGQLHALRDLKSAIKYGVSQSVVNKVLGAAATLSWKQVHPEARLHLAPAGLLSSPVFSIGNDGMLSLDVTIK